MGSLKLRCLSASSDLSREVVYNLTRNIVTSASQLSAAASCPAADSDSRNRPWRNLGKPLKGAPRASAALNIIFTPKSAVSQIGVVRHDIRGNRQTKVGTRHPSPAYASKWVGTAFSTAWLVEFALNADDALLFRPIRPLHHRGNAEFVTFTHRGRSGRSAICVDGCDDVRPL
jgi:hypothetical protein